MPADVVLFCLCNCLFPVLQWRVIVLWAPAKYVHLHDPAAVWPQERGTTNSQCPQRPASASAPQSPISGAQWQKTHPERVWGDPENQENYNLLKWRGQARTHQSYLSMGGSVETLTGAVPGGNSRWDIAAKLTPFPTRTKSPSTDTLMLKKALFLIRLFRFGNWFENEQQNLWSPC